MPKPHLHVVRDSDSDTSAPPPERECRLLSPGGGNDPRDRYISKLGGLPYLSASEAWPGCSRCGQPLNFVAQIRSDDAAIGAGFPKMLRFFYCFSCAVWWDVDGQGFHLSWRAIDPKDTLLPAKYTPLNLEPRIEPKALRFRRAPDYPHPLDYPPFAAMEPTALRLATGRFPVRSESKIGGYPAWLQKPDVPPCRHCGKPMRFLGQFESGFPRGVDWADKGRLYLFGCPDACDPEALSLLVQGE